MVSGISFSNIATDSFTVSWTGPTDYLTHVSRYGVSWTPGTSGGIDTEKAVSTDITGLPTPGAVYTVTVATYNNVTQVGSPRKVSSNKEQATSKLFFAANVTKNLLNNSHSNKGADQPAHPRSLISTFVFAA